MILDSEPELALEPLYETKSSFDLTLEFALSGNWENFFILGSQSHYETFSKARKLPIHEFLILEENTWHFGLRALSKFCGIEGNVSFIFSSSSFYNIELRERLFHLHETYKAQFTFSDAYIRGMGIEILDAEILLPLASLAERRNCPINHLGLFEVIKIDVNAFDVETEIAAIDMRPLRLNAHTTNTDNYLLAKKLNALMPGMAKMSPEEILNTVLAHSKDLRTVPNYINIQLTETCPQECSYCPWAIFGFAKKQGQMEMGLFKKIIDDIDSLNPFATISISLWGEPSLYTHIYDAISYVLGKKKLTLHIESSGLGWGRDGIEKIHKISGKEKLVWIFSLDSHDEMLYEKMRGKGFAEAWSIAQFTKELFSSQVYFQTVRSQLNEDNVQAFYKSNKEAGRETLIQKFNNFSRRIPDLRVADIAPFRRSACWHLKRDLNVFYDGRIPQCKEDVKAEHIIGNLVNESIEAVFARNQDLYLNHLNGKYPNICESCDEFYTFNA